jgi:hypothetical protein
MEKAWNALDSDRNGWTNNSVYLIKRPSLARCVPRAWVF